MATPYASADDLKQRLPAQAVTQLLSEAGEDPSVADDACEAIIAEAQALFDSKLASCGFTVPITGKATDPDMVTLRSHVVSVAKFLMLDRRGMTSYDPAAERLYNAAMDWLKAPALSIASPSSQAATTSTVIRAGSETQVFGIRPDGTNPFRNL